MRRLRCFRSIVMPLDTCLDDEEDDNDDNDDDDQPRIMYVYIIPLMPHSLSVPSLSSRFL